MGGCIGACQALDQDCNTFANRFAPDNETLPGIERHFSEHGRSYQCDLARQRRGRCRRTSSVTGRVLTSAKATGCGDGSEAGRKGEGAVGSWGLVPGSSCEVGFLLSAHYVLIWIMDPFYMHSVGACLQCTFSKALIVCIFSSYFQVTCLRCYSIPFPFFFFSKTHCLGDWDCLRSKICQRERVNPCKDDNKKWCDPHAHTYFLCHNLGKRAPQMFLFDGQVARYANAIPDLNTPSPHY